MSRRLARSPAPPKITRTQGSAGFATGSISLFRPGLDLGFDVPAELVSHCRQQLVGEAFLFARAEAGIERRGQDIRRDGLFDRRLDGPAALAGILDEPRIPL